MEGYPPYAYCKNALGLAEAAEQYGSTFFKNGARPTGVLMVDQVLGKEKREALREELKTLAANDNPKSSLAVLEANMKYQAITTSNNEAQFIDTRKFQIAEVARIFRVPLSLLMENERATYHNSEQESLGFLKYSLRPYLIRIEQALKYNLLKPAERKNYYFEFDVEGLLRGSSTERGNWYKTMRMIGGLTINEIREKENMPPVEGGDDLYVPLNMAPVGDLSKILLDEGDTNNGNA